MRRVEEDGSPPAVGAFEPSWPLLALEQSIMGKGGERERAKDDLRWVMSVP